MASGTAAITTASFTTSLGVNTHLDFGGAYGNLSTVDANLTYLGISNVRDSASNSGDLQIWQQVAQATGVKFDDYIGETSVSGMQSELGLMSSFASAGILNAIEGGNEEDDSYPASLGNSLGATAAMQAQVYALGQHLGLPTINMSFGAGWTAANNWIGDYGNVGDLSGVANYGNAHTYPSGAPDSSINQLISDAKLAASSLPVINTEFGYNTSSVDQTQIAKWTLDGALDSFVAGDPKTYFYALYDDSSGAWGLFNSDGSARPAATALHDLTSLLGDSGGSFTPGSLSYSLSGTASGDNSLLMEKSDGSYWLALWNESVSSHDVTLTLGANASEIEVFDPLTGTNATQTVSNTGSITLTMPDHPVLVEIIGASGSTATTATGGATTAAATTTTSSTTPASTTTGSTTDPTATTPATTSFPVIADGAGDNNIVATVNNSTVSAGDGNNSVFLGGTGDVVSLGNGANTVQAYQGGNTITTGSGNDSIRIAGSGNVIDAGGGQNTIADSGGNNTIVLPGAGGNDNIYGYPMSNGDTLDLRSMLANTSWTGDPSTLASFISVADVNNNAVISVIPTGTAGGAASAVATLNESGSISLQTLLTHSLT